MRHFHCHSYCLSPTQLPFNIGMFISFFLKPGQSYVMIPIAQLKSLLYGVSWVLFHGLSQQWSEVLNHLLESPMNCTKATVSFIYIYIKNVRPFAQRTDNTGSFSRWMAAHIFSLFSNMLKPQYLMKSFHVDLEVSFQLEVVNQD